MIPCYLCLYSLIDTFVSLKDLEYRNAQLRTQVANLKLQKEAEVEELEIKMGWVELDLIWWMDGCQGSC